MNDQTKTTSYIIPALLLIATFALAIPAIQNADAYQCTSQHSGSKCYATHQYDVTSDFHGLRADSEVQYHSGSDGAVVYSHWLDLDNGDIVEVAWQDTVDDSNDPHYVCGHNTIPVDTWGSPSDNTAYEFEVEDIDKNETWDMRADGTTDTNCDYDAETEFAIDSQVGYEITHNNEVSLETVDSDNMQFWDSGYWFFWQSSYGTHGKFLQPGGFNPDHFVDYCGTGSEQYYHSEHGYGSEPGTC